jgi:hypothetical protein
MQHYRIGRLQCEIRQATCSRLLREDKAIPGQACLAVPGPWTSMAAMEMEEVRITTHHEVATEISRRIQWKGPEQGRSEAHPSQEVVLRRVSHFPAGPCRHEHLPLHHCSVKPLQEQGSNEILPRTPLTMYTACTPSLGKCMVDVMPEVALI